MYLKFPDLYHAAAAGKFGRIKSVSINRESRVPYYKVPYYTTEEKSDYQYSFGFFIHLFAA